MITSSATFPFSSQPDQLTWHHVNSSYHHGLRRLTPQGLALQGRRGAFYCLYNTVMAHSHTRRPLPGTGALSQKWVQ